jgi:hypothetical protein
MSQAIKSEIIRLAAKEERTAAAYARMILQRHVIKSRAASRGRKSINLTVEPTAATVSPKAVTRG